MSKRCTGCGQLKELEAFSKNATGKLGRRSRCKECADRAERARYASQPEANRARTVARRDERRARYLAQEPEKRNARIRAWRLAHPERDRANMTAWHEAHPTYRATSYRKWMREHPDEAKAHDARRRARKLNAPGRGVTADDLRELKATSLGLCAYCLRQRKLTVDHVEALARGGAHDPSNLVMACQPCNSRKRDRGVLCMLSILKTPNA